MAAQDPGLDYPVSMTKCGLLPEELELGVTSKLISLFAEDDIPKDFEEDIKTLKKCFAPRQCTDNPSRLDMRRSSSKIAQQLQVLPGNTTSPLKAQKDTSGKQGVKKFDKQMQESYHKDQGELFKLLLASGKFPGYVGSTSDTGYLQRANGEQLSPSEFCNALDAVTRKYIDTEASESTVDGMKPFRDDLRTVYDKCEMILMKRQCASLATENDIMLEKEYKQWKNHALVIVSFGALVVALNVLSKKSGASFMSELEQ